MFLDNALAFFLVIVNLADACCDGIWIDFRYEATVGDFAWNSSSCASTYTHWNDSQPDNYGGQEWFAGISYQTANGTWRDYESYSEMECGCQITSSSCDALSGWRSVTDGVTCYYISENHTDWDTCKADCADISAEMLCIEDFETNDLIYQDDHCTVCDWMDYCDTTLDAVNATCCAGLWIGIEQVSTEGEWEWTDSGCSSSYANWNGYEPQHYGEDEYFAVIAEWETAGAWYSVPGTDDYTEAYCGCEIVTESACDTDWISYNSSDFVQTCYYINKTETVSYGTCWDMCDALSADMLCVLDTNQNTALYAEVTCTSSGGGFFFGGGGCFWHESHLREEWLWHLLGTLCFIVQGLVTIHMFLIVFRGAGKQIGGTVMPIESNEEGGTTKPRRVDLSVVPNPMKSAYGRLLDMPYEASESEPEIRANGEVDEMINTWLLRGAVAEIVFAMGLGGLGCTMLLHHHRISVSLYLDAIEGFICFVSKVVIVTAAYKVQQNLSALSREVAWYWIYIFGTAKFFMGIASFLVFVAYMIFGSDDSSWGAKSGFCMSAHLFYSALLSEIVFQTITGVALYGIHIRAVNKIGSISVFYEVVGFWWVILVLATFAVGIFIWMIGANFMIQENRDGFQKIGVYFSFASFFQACAGASIFCINSRVRAHFASSKGEKTIQMMEKSPK